MANSQSDCCYEYGQGGDESMFGTPWKRQPRRKLRENHASLDALNEKTDDTRTEDISLTLRSRGVPQRGGRRISHGDQILPLQTYTHKGGPGGRKQG